jgi:hypothetical protein
MNPAAKRIQNYVNEMIRAEISKEKAVKEHGIFSDAINGACASLNKEVKAAYQQAADRLALYIQSF